MSDEGEGEGEDKGLPAPPKIAAPPAPSLGPNAKGGGLFDTGWGTLLGDGGPKPLAPLPGLGSASATGKAQIPSFAPPGAAKVASSEPKTSDESEAVAGEFGTATDKAEPDAPGGEPKVEAPRDEPAASPNAEAEAETEAETEAEAQTEADGDAETEAAARAADPLVVAPSEAADHNEDEDEDEDEAADQNEDEAADHNEDEASPEPPPAANEPPPVVVTNEPPDSGSGSGSRIWIAIVGALVVAGLLYASRSGTQDERSANGPTKPNTAAPEPDKPAPRSKVKTHAKTPSGASPAPRPDDPDSETGTGPETETETETGADSEPTPEPPAPRAKVSDPRDPSLIPPGTPDDNAKAFLKLPASIHDGAPVGGIGRSGIHIDEVAMSSGRDNPACENPRRSFVVADVEFINICVRVVHPREAETLRVIWEKDGAVARRGVARVPENLHAYKTRAYLQLRPEYVGSWRVRITPEDEEDTNLAVAEFVIK